MPRPPVLAVVVGPSGVGKGTVIRELLARHPEVWLSISATTRAPRPGEVDGVHYTFVSDPEFDDLVASGGMLEWAEVFGMNRYGTPRAPVEEHLAGGSDVLLELDLAGARQVRHTAPDALQVFIAPPSFAELEERLRGRGTETSEARERRLATAREELAAVDEFDLVIVNADVSDAAHELAVVMGLEEPKVVD
ncbi:MAG TPA: guanylate kinase [Actinomycetales bacterium]|nr:guanylate kinase [Actinomycetales bacterium]